MSLDIQKNELHYFIELFRKKDCRECGDALNNVIHTMSLCRHRKICDEDFSDLDFVKVPLNAIAFSIQNKHQSNFEGCSLSEFNFLGGHSADVISLAWSEDERYIATGDEDGNIIIWDTKSLLMKQVLHAHSAAVNSIVFSSSTKYLLSGSSDKSIKLWDIDENQCLIEIDNQSAVTTLAFSSDQERVLVGYQNGTAKLWNLKSQKCLKIMRGHGYPVSIVTFSPSDDYMLTGNIGETLLWDLHSKKYKSNFWGHASYIKSVLFTENYVQFRIPLSEISAFWMASVSERGDIFLNNFLSKIAFSPDGKYFMINAQHQYYIDGKPIEYNHVQEHCSALTISPSQKEILLSHGKNIEIWNIEEKICCHKFNGYGQKIKAVDISKDGRYCLTVGNYKLKLWDLKTNMFLKDLCDVDGSLIKSVKLSRDARHCLVLDELNRFFLYDIEKRYIVKEYDYDGSGFIIVQIGFLDDGASFEAHSQSLFEHEILIYNFITQTEVSHMRMDWDIRIEASCLSHDRTHLMAVMNKKFKTAGALFDVKSENCTKIFNSDRYYRRYSKEARRKYFAAVDGNIEEIDLSNEIYLTSISDDNKYCATVEDDNKAIIWSVQTGRCVKILKKHRKRINAIDFIDGGKYFITGSLDFSARLWVSKTGFCCRRFQIPVENNADIFWCFPFCVVSRNHVFRIYKMDYSCSNINKNVQLINTFYNIDDINIEGCNFKSENLKGNAEKIIQQFGGKL